MHTIQVLEFQNQVLDWLRAVEKGEEVVIERDGHPIARLTGAQSLPPPRVFPDLGAFRRSIPPAQTPSSAIIREMRNDERY